MSEAVAQGTGGPFPAFVPVETGRLEMRRAWIYATTARNSYAVQLEHLPGVINIQCTHCQIEDRRAFEDAIRKLHPHPRMGRDAVPLKLGGDEAVDVMVRLGPYCVGERSFVDCSLFHPAVAAVQEEGEGGGDASPANGVTKRALDQESDGDPSEAPPPLKRASSVPSARVANVSGFV